MTDQPDPRPDARPDQPQDGPPSWDTYGGPAYGQQPPGQPGYPVYGASYGGPQVPMHPQATTAMVLGIIGLGGTFLCGLPILLGPFAWFVGARTKREIAAEPHRWRGAGEANVGMVLGIVCTALLLLALLAVLLVVVIAVAASNETTY